MRIYFVRHGQTDANIHYDQYPWNTNCPINQTGRKQVAQTAAFLHNELDGKQVVLVASPLLRAQQTAAIIGEALSTSPITDDRLLELQVGEWQTRDIATVYAYFMSLAPDERFTFVPPGGESWADCGQRFATAIAEKTEPVIVIVSHSAPIQSVVGTLLASTYEEWATYEIRNASVSLLERMHDEWQAAYIGRIFDPSSQVGLF